MLNGNIMEIMEEGRSVHIREVIQNEKHMVKMEGGKE